MFLFLISNSIDHHDEHPIIHTNGPMKTLVSTGNGPNPSSSPSSSSSSSSISSSDVDEFYGDPSDRLPLNQNTPNDDITSNDNNNQVNTHLSHFFNKLN